MESFFNSTSYMNINNNSYIPYNQKINYSAINNKFNQNFLNDESDFESYNNIFNRERNELNKNKFYSRIYIKKSINRNFISKSKSLKNLVSPEKFHTYYNHSLSNTNFHNYIMANNINQFNLEKKIKSIKIAIKTFTEDNLTCKRLSKIIFFPIKESLESINIIQNKKYCKNFTIKTPPINKIKIDLDLINIGDIDQKRKIGNNISNTLKKELLDSNIKKDEFIDKTLSTTFHNNTLIQYDSFNTNHKNAFSTKLFISNDSKDDTNKLTKIKENNISNENIIKNKSVPQIKQFFLSEEEENKSDLNVNNKKRIIKNLKKSKNPNSISKKNRFIFMQSNDLDNNIKEDYIKINTIKSFNFDNLNNIFIDKINKINKMDISQDLNLKKHTFYISKESYEEFIDQLILKTYEKKVNLYLSNSNNTNSKDNSILNDKVSENKEQKELDDILTSFEEKVKLLKNNYLCLLVRKHFLKKKSDKEKLIKDINMLNKREIFYKEYLNVVDIIRQKFKSEFDENNKIYLDKIINILKKYKTISKSDIIYTKRIFLEENDLSPSTLDTEDDNKFSKLIKGLFKDNSNSKKILVATSIVLPLFYGINYLMSLNQK